MGIGYDEFWTLNPRKLNVLVSGYKLRRKVEDEKSWMLGGYVFEAVSYAIGNAVRKKGQKAANYFEKREQPYLHNIDNNELTDEQKKRGRELLLAQLNVMKANFNIKHGE